MASYFSTWQKLWITLLLITLLAAALTTQPISYLWLTGSTLFGIILISDFMFSNEKNFLYDPDYNNWKSKTQSDA